jgi:hypothetical protein
MLNAFASDLDGCRRTGAGERLQDLQANLCPTHQQHRTCRVERRLAVSPFNKSQQPNRMQGDEQYLSMPAA